jgi:GNAT superfamily N-acetyltransferase
MIDRAPGFIVRPVVAEDHGQWLPLWDGYNAFYGRSGPTALAPEVTRETWRRLFDGLEPVHGLVAERNGEILGFVHYLFHRSTTATGPDCYLRDLFTRADTRGAGVGEALIRSVGQRAKAAGASRVYWQTHETNATARRLYDRVASHAGFLVYAMPV